MKNRMCRDEECPKKYMCYRYWGKEDKTKQRYFSQTPRDLESAQDEVFICLEYWPIAKKEN